MQLHSESQWYVFPGYGGDFRDMGPWVSHWQKALPGHFGFSPGFAGGGVLSVPFSTPQRERNKAVLRDLRWHHKAIYGLALGNEAGQELSRWISCALPEAVPSVVAKLGLAETVPNPKVKVTVEHVDGLSDTRYLIVVPRANRKSIKLAERLPEWFNAFGVSVASAQSSVPPIILRAMQDWFDDLTRPMVAFPLSGGPDIAAWQLAVAYYVAEYWDVHARGLDTVHFVAEVEGCPNFRKYWTSNK